LWLRVGRTYKQVKNSFFFKFKLSQDQKKTHILKFTTKKKTIPFIKKTYLSLNQERKYE
jgi:hypothetical protein